MHTGQGKEMLSTVVSKERETKRKDPISFPSPKPLERSEGIFSGLLVKCYLQPELLKSFSQSAQRAYQSCWKECVRGTLSNPHLS